jgi:hypothetical protein
VHALDFVVTLLQTFPSHRPEFCVGTGGCLQPYYSLRWLPPGSRLWRGSFVWSRLSSFFDFSSSIPLCIYLHSRTPRTPISCAQAVLMQGLSGFTEGVHFWCRSLCCGRWSGSTREREFACMCPFHWDFASGCKWRWSGWC